MIIDTLADGKRLYLKLLETNRTYLTDDVVPERLVVGMSLVLMAGPTERYPVVDVVAGSYVSAGKDVVGVPPVTTA